MSDDREKRALEHLLDAGASLGGAGTGALVGTAIAGPPGAVVGAGAGWATEKLLSVAGEMALRHLAPRAEKRVGRVVILARDEISARVLNGEVPREDLRSGDPSGHAPADELLEAVLRASADTHEERKLPYIAHLLASIAFEPDITPAHLNQLIATAHDLTYRQLVALAVYADLNPHAYQGPDFWGEAPEFAPTQAAELSSIRADLLDLFRRGLVRVGQRERRVRKEKPYRPSTSRRGMTSYRPEHEMVKEPLPWPAMPAEMSPRSTRMTDEGELLVRLMRLDQIPGEDREDLFLTYVRIPSRGTR